MCLSEYLYIYKKGALRPKENQTKDSLCCIYVRFDCTRTYILLLSFSRGRQNTAYESENHFFSEYAGFLSAKILQALLLRTCIGPFKYDASPPPTRKVYE